MTQTLTKNNSIKPNPYQIFFISAFLNFMLFVSLIFLTYSNNIKIDLPSHVYHAYPLIYIVFAQLILGFLFTLFPNFLNIKGENIIIYKIISFVFMLSSFGYFISVVYSWEFFYIFVAINIAVMSASLFFLFKLFVKSKSKGKSDCSWLLLSLSSAVLGNILYLVSLFEIPFRDKVLDFSIFMGFFIFIFGTFFVISQKVIPQFDASKDDKYTISKSKGLLEIIFLFLVIKVILLSSGNLKIGFLVDLPLAIFILREIREWRLPFFKMPALIWVMYLALYYIPIALLLSSVESISNVILENPYNFHIAVIHLLALGYFLTLFVGFATRVVLAYTKKGIFAGKFLFFIVILLQASLILELVASLGSKFGANPYLFTNLSSLVLILALLIWSFRYFLPILLSSKIKKD